MWKWLLFDLVVGSVIGAAVLGVIIQTIPRSYRGPRLAVFIWLGLIVLFAVLRRVLMKRGTP